MGIPKRDKTRNRLLMAAQGLVIEGGFAALTVNNLTDRAEVALGTFYNYYRTREDVLEDMWELWVAAHEVDAVAITEGMHDSLAIVATKVRQTMHQSTPGSDLGRLLFECNLPTERYILKIRRFFKQDLEAGMACGAFKVDNEVIVISMVSGSIYGVMQDINRGVLEVSAIDEVAEMTLRLLGVPPEVAATQARLPIEFLPPRIFPLSALELMPPLGPA